MKRRTFVSGSAALAAAGLVSTTASAAAIQPYSWDLNPPTDTRDNFIAWGKARGEDPVFLGQRWDRFQALVKNKDIWGAATIRAFLLTPREEFVTKANLANTYQVHYLDIGGKFLKEDGTLTKDIMPDFLHLSKAGYQIWADAITPKLAELAK